MTRQHRITRAISVVDRLYNLSDEDRQVLKKRTVEAALGDNSALGHIIISSYDLENREMIGEILCLILPAD